MKITVTKKEYDAVQKLLINFADACGKDLDISEELRDCLNAEGTHEKGSWGELKVRRVKGDDKDKLILYINPDCTEDILLKLYDPIFTKIGKWVANTVKVFTSIFTGLEKKFEQVSKKWFED